MNCDVSHIAYLHSMHYQGWQYSSVDIATYGRQLYSLPFNLHCKSDSCLVLYSVLSSYLRTLPKRYVTSHTKGYYDVYFVKIMTFSITLLVLVYYFWKYEDFLKSISYYFLYIIQAFSLNILNKPGRVTWGTILLWCVTSCVVPQYALPRVAVYIISRYHILEKTIAREDKNQDIAQEMQR